jgi:glycosyltransferase involved in cell wall biosynthesis
VDLAKAERFRYGLALTRRDRGNDPRGDVSRRASDPDFSAASGPGHESWNEGRMATPPAGPRRPIFPGSQLFTDVVCLSHLRWDFVFQRPQHLMTRWARSHRVFFVEEPIDSEGPARLDVHTRQQGVQVVVPRFPLSIARPDAASLQAQLLRRFFERNHISDYLLWYYTPMAVEFTREMTPRAVVYDCMDELSAFAGAPAEIPLRERELLRRAQVVFTGGLALYEHKRNCHENVHPFPSSVDVAHFARARVRQADPADQRYIPHPRLGFFGVIDERLDVRLLARLAALRPHWQLVMIGPTVKIDPAVLPRAANIHYLGPKRYDELPAYLAGWDVALLPFARNEATRFISPTKTPEYLAAGKPVVSTSIRDVVRPYGARGLARIADTAEGFAAAIELAMAEDPIERQRDADAFLTQTSWDGTWTRMHRLVLAAVSQSEPLAVDRDVVSEPGVA